MKKKLSLLFMLLAFLAMAQPHVSTAPESGFDFVETNHEVVDFARVFVKKLPLGIKRKIIEGELILKINSTKIVEISKDGLFSDIKWLEENIADRANIKTLAAFQDVTYLDNGVEKTGDLNIVQKGDDVGIDMVEDASSLTIALIKKFDGFGNLQSWVKSLDEVADAKLLAKLNDLDKGYFEALDGDLANTSFKNAIENKPGLVAAWKSLYDMGEDVIPASLRINPTFLIKFADVVKNNSLGLNADAISNLLKAPSLKTGSNGLPLKWDDPRAVLSAIERTSASGIPGVTISHKKFPTPSEGNESFVLKNVK